MGKPLIITAALVGGELTRRHTPYLPLSPDEIAQEAKLCVEAGASVIHVHARDPRGQPSNDPKIFKNIIQSIKKKCDPIPVIQVSTGGTVGDDFKSRFLPLKSKPDMASLNAGSINFGEDVFQNPRPFIEKLASNIMKNRIKPEIEIYDLSHLEVACDLIDQGLISLPVQFQFVLGVKGGLKASEKNLRLLVSRLPKKSTWTVAGIGKNEFPMAALAIRWGGHVRVGLEDNLYLEKDLLARGSHELVEKAVALGKRYGRAPATVLQTRRLLKLCQA